jgi:hypothetical protein
MPATLRRILALGALAAAVATLPACERRVVSTSGILMGVPGAEGGILDDAQLQEANADGSGGPVAETQWDAVLAPYHRERAEAERRKRGDDDDDDAPPEPVPVEIAPLRKQYPDGRIELISAAPSHVIYHLTQTLANNETDLLFDQVLSDALKTSYRQRARDPREAIEWLTKRDDDIAALFAAMPLAENTPGVRMTNIGRNRFRIRVEPDVAIDARLRLSTIDIIIEQGRFRLLMLR